MKNSTQLRADGWVDGDTCILQADGLQKALGEGAARQSIIDGLTFSVKRGEFLCVVGPSGCGKTTLLMCLAGLYEVDGGKLLFEDKTVTAPPPGVSVVFQDYSRSLLPWKSNLRNVMFGMKRTPLTKGNKVSKATELMDAVGLKGFERHYPWQVSGGMQQRIAIARALAAQSRLLLLDEPLAAVDAQTRAELQDLLLELSRRFNQTCVLVTHDVDEAVYLADRVLVLSRRPTRIVAEIVVPLPKPRDQLETREHRTYLEVRHRVIGLIRSMRRIDQLTRGETP